MPPTPLRKSKPSCDNTIPRSAPALPFLVMASLLFCLSAAHAERFRRDSGKDSGVEDTANKPANKSIDARVESVEGRIRVIRNRIANLLLKNPCIDDSQCEVLEAGSRNCGGPSGYEIVSIANPKLSEIKSKLQELVRAEDELNALTAVGGCSPVPVEPKAECRKDNCAIRR